MKTTFTFLLAVFTATIFSSLQKINAQSWSLTGNSGTNGKINFIGTTDANALVFRVNNQKSGFIGYSSSSGFTSFGYHALYLNSTGYFNTGFGYNALSANTTGNNNTGIGTNALRSNVNGSGNTAAGSGALSVNSSGMNNTATGYTALYFNSTGSSNTALGSFSLYTNHSGYGNVAVGAYSLFKNTTGYGIVAIGDSALYNNQSGYSNVAIGAGALFNNKIGHNVVAVGDSALYNQSANTGIVDNTAIGSKSLYGNTTGVYNTAVGTASLKSNTEGNNNVAIGNYALGSNTTGGDNSAVGLESLANNKEGDYNTAHGNHALQYNTSGYFNTAIGNNSMYYNQTGAYNTAVGVDAGKNGVNESYCTYLGYNAGKGGALNQFTNSMALGNGARYTASNYIAVGNTAIRSIKGQVGFTTFSDGRFKKDIQENVPGLIFINKLKPVTYHLDVTGISKFLKEDKDENNSIEKTRGQNILQQARAEKEKITYTGFVAQDVEKAAKELKYEFSGVDKPENENSLYGLRYAEFVVPLVKAVQELSQENNELKAEIRDMKAEIKELEVMIGSNLSTASHQLTTTTSASLKQNIPNPFINTTTISYTLPQLYNTAKIIITDKEGKPVKEINITGRSKGTFNMNASALAAGTYNYSLYVDGKLVAAKQMLVAK